MLYMLLLSQVSLVLSDLVLHHPEERLLKSYVDAQLWILQLKQLLSSDKDEKYVNAFLPCCFGSLLKVIPKLLGSRKEPYRVYTVQNMGLRGTHFTLVVLVLIRLTFWFFSDLCLCATKNGLTHFTPVVFCMCWFLPSRAENGVTHFTLKAISATSSCLYHKSAFVRTKNGLTHLTPEVFL